MQAVDLLVSSIELLLQGADRPVEHPDELLIRPVVTVWLPGHATAGRGRSLPVTRHIVG